MVIGRVGGDSLGGYVRPARPGGSMLLVPRQLRRAGMTGDVPYYGGRLSPAQAYAASHPSVHPPAKPAPASRTDALPSLQHLLDTEVITPEEYAELRARLGV
jgi:hypothetical protein